MRLVISMDNRMNLLQALMLIPTSFLFNDYRPLFKFSSAFDQRASLFPMISCFHFHRTDLPVMQVRSRRQSMVSVDEHAVLEDEDEMSTNIQSLSHSATTTTITVVHTRTKSTNHSPQETTRSSRMNSSCSNDYNGENSVVHGPG